MANLIQGSTIVIYTAKSHRDKKFSYLMPLGRVVTCYCGRALYKIVYWSSKLASTLKYVVIKLGGSEYRFTVIAKKNSKIFRGTINDVPIVHGCIGSLAHLSILLFSCPRRKRWSRSRRRRRTHHLRRPTIWNNKFFTKELSFFIKMCY